MPAHWPKGKVTSGAMPSLPDVPPPQRFESDDESETKIGSRVTAMQKQGNSLAAMIEGGKSKKKSQSYESDDESETKMVSKVVTSSKMVEGAKKKKPALAKVPLEAKTVGPDQEKKRASVLSAHYLEANNNNKQESKNPNTNQCKRRRQTRVGVPTRMGLEHLGEQCTGGPKTCSHHRTESLRPRRQNRPRRLWRRISWDGRVNI